MADAVHNTLALKSSSQQADRAEFMRLMQRLTPQQLEKALIIGRALAGDKTLRVSDALRPSAKI